MTLHAAKGLEFDTVFLPGWEEGLFPHQRAVDHDGAAGLEEERRLAYVGLTRAKKRAVVTFAANRRVYNQWQSALPSRFIDELPKDHIEIASAPGVYRAPADAGGVVDWGPASPGRGPGFVRMQASPRRGGLVIDATATAVTHDGPSRIAQGARVFHQKFGYGTVAVVEGNKLEIAFDKAGTKKVIDSFVTLA
jgi:DNA helicase-2/ATP-dependent DNA helicase PcrA